jgi:ribosomal subunit interface protein
MGRLQKHGEAAMNVRIRAHRFEVTKALRQHVERCLGLVLGRFGSRIGQVTVRFWDEDKIKRCQIDIDLRPVRLRIEDRDGDPFAAVEHAASRAARSIGRAIERELSG